jgi:RimJ/RimL family protein N-acetyltransferase
VVSPEIPDWIETIRTERLTLLPLAVTHAEEMAVALADPGLHSFIGGVPLSAADLRSRYERLVAGSPDVRVAWHNWVIRLDATAELVGTVQATVTHRGSEAEVAWVVGTPWQGRGIASEAARALARWLRARRMTTLTAHVHPDHDASAAVARAAGLAPTDQVHDGEVLWQWLAG